MARPYATQVEMVYSLAAGSNYIDIARGLSLLNRKLFRSGYCYAVEGFTVLGTAGDTFAITKIPEGYTSERAWKHVFDQWRKQRAETLDTSSQVTGRWSDFKVFMDEGHALAPGVDPLSGATTVELSPISIGAFGPIFTGGEWNHSEIVAFSGGNPHAFEVGMLGADNTPTYGGIIEAWGDTRRTVLSPDPNTPGSLSTSWLEHTGPGPEDLEVEVENLIETEGDEPPYAIVNDPALDPIYVGGAQSCPRGLLHGMGFYSLPNTLVPTYVPGGLFPLGLFCVNKPGDNEMAISVKLVRGAYKGVAARRMGDSR